MSLGLAVLVVVGFALIVGRSGLISHARTAGGRARASLAVLGDPTIEDDEKEKRLRADALALFRLLGQILFGSAAALLVPFAAVWGLERLGVGSLSAVLDILGRLDFLVAVSVAGLLWYGVLRRLRGG